jgi:hypothetical protein
MLYFPQLASGALSQYPLTRRHVTRSVINAAEDGQTVVAPDAGASRVAWELKYAGLSTGERQSIEQLFAAARGRLGTFTFLDPTGNLLSWSEDFTKPGWEADPLLRIAAGATDPRSGNNAMRVTNTAQAPQRLRQRIGGPSWFGYAFSVYARAGQASSIRLVVEGNAEEQAGSFNVGAQWIRAVQSAGLSNHADGVAFAIELPAGAQVDLFGAQAEAQPGAGEYTITTARSGVYAQSRFDSDRLASISEGPEQHSPAVRIVSGVASGA